jgi:multiple sugar transport system substrate-binding protein
MKKVVTGICFALLLIALLPAQEKLVVWCHSVHYQVAAGTTGEKINVVSQFEKENNCTVEWVQIPWAGMQDKVLRQASLGKGEADVIMIENTWANSSLLNMFENLNPYLKKIPFVDKSDIPDDFWSTYALNGEVKALPFRSSPEILHYNKTYFSKFGIAEAPKTLEALIADAKKTTFTREDGAKVYGLGVKPDETPMTFIKAAGGDIIGPNFTVLINKPEAVYGISLLRDLYAAGAIPPNYLEMTPADYQNLVCQGIISIFAHGDAKYDQFNDPKQSHYAGSIAVAPIPASEKTSLKVAPAKIAYWGAGIPKNSPKEKKELAYKLINFFSLPDVQLKMAFNANGPMRASTFADQQFAKRVPYAGVDREILPFARTNLPAFTGTSEVVDIIKEQCGLAITGKKSVQDALNEAAKKIEAVLKASGVK